MANAACHARLPLWRRSPPWTAHLRVWQLAWPGHSNHLPKRGGSRSQYITAREVLPERLFRRQRIAAHAGQRQGRRRLCKFKTCGVMAAMAAGHAFCVESDGTPLHTVFSRGDSRPQRRATITAEKCSICGAKGFQSASRVCGFWPWAGQAAGSWELGAGSWELGAVGGGREGEKAGKHSRTATTVAMCLCLCLRTGGGGGPGGRRARDGDRRCGRERGEARGG